MGGLRDGHAAGGLVVRPGAEGEVKLAGILVCVACLFWAFAVWLDWYFGHE